jgi:hypothetical protein
MPVLALLYDRKYCLFDVWLRNRDMYASVTKACDRIRLTCSYKKSLMLETLKVSTVLS